MGAIQDIKIMNNEEHRDKFIEIVTRLKWGTFKNIIFIIIDNFYL